jgi:hypothetical protein
MTILDGSKKDVLNQVYKNALSMQLVALTTAEITARAINDSNGTIYHNTTLNKLQVKLNGSIETITST